MISTPRPSADAPTASTYYVPPRASREKAASAQRGAVQRGGLSYDSIQVETESLDELIRLLKEEGLPLESFERLHEALGISASRLAEAVGVAERTLRRRRKAGQLSSGESERLLRLARLFERAREVLGSSERARTWMTGPVPALSGRAPLDYADTEPGAREVERVLGRIAHGVFS